VNKTYSSSQLRLPAHFFGVYDGHVGPEVKLSHFLILVVPRGNTLLTSTHLAQCSCFMFSVQVANYCRDKIHVVLRDVLRAGKGLGEVGEVDVKEPWEKVFGDCFHKVDDEVSGKATMFSNGSSESRAEPVAADNVGSTAVVAVVCSSHVIAANCGDSRVVLCRGKEPIALSVDHKV
jgi:serine/threonine protein phosphatase PrpC